MSNASAGTPAIVAPSLPAPAKAAAPDPLDRAYDLPCRLVLEVPAVDFNVGSLMDLRPGSIVRTRAQHNEDLPIKANGQFVGVVECDVIGDRLAVRLLGMA